MASSKNVVFPLPLYIHGNEMKALDSYSLIDAPPSMTQMEKIFPMRIFATILDIQDDSTISFRWGNDDRNLEQFQEHLNSVYSLKDPRRIIRIYENQTYVIHHEDNYYRCQMSDSMPAVLGKREFRLIDYGRTIQTDRDDADLFYYHHYEEDDDTMFAFADVCRIADKNQCEHLSVATSAKQFSINEEVEIFLLSFQSPYYAVVSSLRNLETKLLTSAINNDLFPEVAQVWNKVTGNQIETIPADRPTLSLSPRWIHGTFPVLCTIPFIERLDKIAIYDLNCALRACLLVEHLRQFYENPNVRADLQVTNAYTQLGIGVIVVAWDQKTNRYYRAKISATSANLTSFDLVGTDFPQWKSINHSIDNLWRLSTTLQMLPTMVHYVTAIRGDLFTCDINLLLIEMARTQHQSNTVALVQQSDESMVTQILVCNEANNLWSLIELLPIRDYSENKEGGMERSLSLYSLAPSIKPKKDYKNWQNKSHPRNPNKKKEEEKKEGFYQGEKENNVGSNKNKVVEKEATAAAAPPEIAT
jgi:hypothetical protein